MQRILLVTALLVSALSVAASPPGNVRGKVRQLKDGAARPRVEGVVVYLEGVPGKPPAPVEPPPAIKQKDLAFEPGVAVVQKGTAVEFPNEDRVFHNVFSVSAPARFDLGLYKSGASKTVEMKKAGVVDIYCNIHPQMNAKVLVLDTPWYARVADDGSFALEGVPPGTYPIVVWQPYGPEHRGEVTVPAAGVAELSVDLVEGAKRARHLRKDGTPYGRYK